MDHLAIDVEFHDPSRRSATRTYFKDENRIPMSQHRSQLDVQNSDISSSYFETRFEILQQQEHE